MVSIARLLPDAAPRFREAKPHLKRRPVSVMAGTGADNRPDLVHGGVVAITLLMFSGYWGEAMARKPRGRSPVPLDRIGRRTMGLWAISCPRLQLTQGGFGSRRPCAPL